jgi:hypothetical protein
MSAGNKPTSVSDIDWGGLLRGAAFFVDYSHVLSRGFGGNARPEHNERKEKKE